MGTDSSCRAALGYPPMTSEKDEFYPCTAIFCGVTDVSRGDAWKRSLKDPGRVGAGATSSAGMAVSEQPGFAKGHGYVVHSKQDHFLFTFS